MATKVTATKETVEKNGAEASGEGAKPIRIPTMRYVEAVVTIRGVTSLICHRFGESAIQAIEDKQQNIPRNKNEPRRPEAEYEEALYKLSDGRYGFPARAIKKCLVIAGQRFADTPRVVLNGTLKVRSNDPTEYLPIRYEGKPNKRKDMVRLGGINRSADVRYRPEFFPWEIDVPIRYNASRLSEDSVYNVFLIGGEQVALGDDRIECGGQHGEFEVVNFQITSEHIRHTLGEKTKR